MRGMNARIRGFSVWLHRGVGLAMTLFLVLVGLTGSLLAFNAELERYFAPHLFAAPRKDAPPLDLATLATRAQALVPQARVEGVLWTDEGQVSVYYAPRTNPQTGAPYELDFTELFVDPWTGRELGRRIRGDLSEGLINLMPFIYDLHWMLALGDVGQWTLGIVALAWSIDCFIGLYLTLPLVRQEFFRRWWRSWLIKRDASRFRFNFDLHRAGGLWVWPLLLIFAWSSVMMDIRPIYEWVMQSMFDYRSPMAAFMAPERPYAVPRLDWHAAQAVGDRLMKEQAAVRNFRVGRQLGLTYLSGSGLYSYEVRGSRDVFERAPKGGGTYVLFDGDTGTFVELDQPTGERTGNTIESWLYALHMARVFGLPYRLFVCALGLLVTVLSITGVVIWLTKRRSSLRARTRPGMELADTYPSKAVELAGTRRAP